MTLGECLEEIRKVYLGGSLPKMNKVGLHLVHKLRHHYFSQGTYPRHGWLLSLEDDRPCLRNRHFKIVVDTDLAHQGSLGEFCPLTNDSVQHWQSMSYKQKIHFLKQGLQA